MSSEPIVFLDFPSNDKIGHKPWNPNTWKTRYVLNYKGLSYKTQWVEYPDVEAECKKIGAAPTAKKPDGQDFYTLPTIYDPNTKKAVSDSWNIAKYLDEAYPDTPKVFFEGTDAFQAVFNDFLWSGLAMLFISVAVTSVAMNPRSEQYFRATREAFFTAKLEDLGTEEQWAAAETMFGKIGGYMEKNGKGKDLLFMGEPGKISFTDIQVAALLTWARLVHGENSVGWKRFASWHGGKWIKFLDQFSQWQSMEH